MRPKDRLKDQPLAGEQDVATMGFRRSRGRGQFSVVGGRLSRIADQWFPFLNADLFLPSMGGWGIGLNVVWVGRLFSVFCFGISLCIAE